MGMFDTVECEYPLPGCPHSLKEFQTKSFGDGFVGGFMDNYTITQDGKLIWHEKTWEYVEEKDRPYYGKPEWKKNPLFRVIGSMKGKSLGDKEIKHHGYINIYTMVGNDWWEYDIKFTDGKVTDVERIIRDESN